ncbi:hypothetical protein [Staphylococcus pettenkoferi]|uniref:hypothetical protein n=1 Tax=Staphylococcus pettenkoferi TaxID=170573 RepID=UPI00066CB52A|nr:hypothetical protein [Staphylococcus pettenkoferi]MDK7115159.1 hypothetical protein [Staphylococcus pettenkoferi]MDK7283112.1 hypothetical protein [Staphylococcus pettenkoferi]
MADNSLNQIQLSLYDEMDEIKAQLSELNETKSWIVNGPAIDLLRRTKQIAILQGRRLTVDKVQNQLQSTTDLTTFQTWLDEISREHQTQFDQLTQELKQADPTSDHYVQLLTDYYQAYGRQHVFNQLNAH